MFQEEDWVVEFGPAMVGTSNAKLYLPSFSIEEAALEKTRWSEIENQD